VISEAALSVLVTSAPLSASNERIRPVAVFSRVRPAYERGNDCWLRRMDGVARTDFADGRAGTFGHCALCKRRDHSVDLLRSELGLDRRGNLDAETGLSGTTNRRHRYQPMVAHVLGNRLEELVVLQRQRGHQSGQQRGVAMSRQHMGALCRRSDLPLLGLFVKRKSIQHILESDPNLNRNQNAGVPKCACPTQHWHCCPRRRVRS
jgi:hypothetical protein